jgi:hypothetical protein
MIAWLAQDWTNVLLLLAAAVFLVLTGIAFAFPIFGGHTASDKETMGIAVRVGAMGAAVFLGLYAMVWALRGALWIVRLLVCNG